MKQCRRCGELFSQRENERPGRYGKRVYCSRACSDPAKTEKSMATLQDRFDASIHYEPNSGCWLWNGHITRGGYGTIRIAETKRHIRAPRFSYERTKGPIPEGVVIRHKCDTPACVNPDHLEAGSHADNARDRVVRNRTRRGQDNPNAKLTLARVAAIRVDPRPYTIIGAEHGVSAATICNVRKGKVWTK